MNVAQLITKLQTLDPEAVVVKFHEKEGYDECWFVAGSHQGENDGLRTNRAKFVKGESRPGFLVVDDRQRTRAKRTPFVILY